MPGTGQRMSVLGHGCFLGGGVGSMVHPCGKRRRPQFSGPEAGATVAEVRAEATLEARGALRGYPTARLARRRKSRASSLLRMPFSCSWATLALRDCAYSTCPWSWEAGGFKITSWLLCSVSRCSKNAQKYNFHDFGNLSIPKMPNWVQNFKKNFLKIKAKNSLAQNLPQNSSPHWWEFC